jgi:hypothetical protein
MTQSGHQHTSGFIMEKRAAMKLANAASGIMCVRPVDHGFLGFAETSDLERLSGLFADRESALTQRVDRPGDEIRTNPPDSS